MPVRNFYVSSEVDGRRTAVTGGPASKDGGMTIRLTQRDQGAIVTVLFIACHVVGTKLVTQVDVCAPGSATERFTIETER